MSDSRRLIGGREQRALFQFPSSPESSDNENYLVYQREAPASRESASPRTVERKNSPTTGRKPLVKHSDQREYHTITKTSQSSNMPERERMDIDSNNGKTGVPTFSRKKGCFVERKWVYLLIVVVIGALLLVGLLAGLLGRGHKSCTPSDETDNGGDNGDNSSLTPAEAFALRLPRGITPLAYTIQLQPFLNGNLTVSGTMTLDIECLEATSNITLNVLNVNVTEGSVHLELKDGGNGTVPNVKELQNDSLHQMVVIYLDGELTANKTYTINMTFVALVNDFLAGLYKSSYQSGNETKYLAVTQFEATDARRVFPCFDEPGYKATFDISIIRERNMTAISNGPLIRTETREDGWLVDYFGTTPKMSTYLVAIVISDFIYLNDSSYRVWARKEVIQSTKYVVSIGPGIIKYYDKFFNINYPMKKTDNVAIPDFNAGAMENWGLITYRETSLLFDPQLSTAYEKQYICQTVAHELAHQWFGNLVTPKWWNDLWLNEGFASYMEYVASDVVEPDWKMLQLFITDKQQSALSLDSLKTSHPISVQVDSPDEINDLFDGISYDKGASIIKMMNLFLGEDAFKKALQTYLRSLAYGNAVSEDLWDHMYNAQNMTGVSTPVNVSSIMNKWSKQTGYPLLTVTRDYDNQIVNLTQNIFLIDSSNVTEEEMNTLWDIPVTWASSSEDPSKWSTYPSLWLPNRTLTTSMIKSLAGSWIIVNVQAAGFYRVNYDLDNWKLIIEQLQSNHNKIDVITRTQLIDDAFSLAKAGILSYTLALNLTKYLNVETEYLPFSTALGNINRIGALFCRSDVYGILKQHVLNLIIPTYIRMGWTNMSQSSVQEQYLQVQAISTACDNDYPDCVQKGVALFQAWKRNPTDKTTINPNLRKIVYCTGIANGNVSDWDFVWNRFKNETVPAEKKKLRSALSCSSEMWILSRLLQQSLDPNGDISRQDATSVISSVAGTDHGRELAFNYVRDKWDVLFEMFGGLSFTLSDVLTSIASRLNTQLEMEEFVSFKDRAFKQSRVGTAKNAFHQALELIGSNIQFTNRSYEEISSWFKLNNNVTGNAATPNSSSNGSAINSHGTSARLTSNNGTGTRNESTTEVRFNQNGTINTSSENTQYNVDGNTGTTSRPTNQTNTNGNVNGNSTYNENVNRNTTNNNNNNENANRNTTNNNNNNENANRNTTNNNNNNENVNRNPINNNNENANRNTTTNTNNNNNNNNENVSRNTTNNNESVNRNTNNNNESVNRNTKNNNESVNRNTNNNNESVNRNTNNNNKESVNKNTNNNESVNRNTNNNNESVNRNTNNNESVNRNTNNNNNESVNRNTNNNESVNRNTNNNNESVNRNTNNNNESVNRNTNNNNESVNRNTNNNNESVNRNTNNNNESVNRNTNSNGENSNGNINRNTNSNPENSNRNINRNTNSNPENSNGNINRNTNSNPENAKGNINRNTNSNPENANGNINRNTNSNGENPNGNINRNTNSNPENPNVNINRNTNSNGENPNGNINRNTNSNGENPNGNINRNTNSNPENSNGNINTPSSEINRNTNGNVQGTNNNNGNRPFII